MMVGENASSRSSSSKSTSSGIDDKNLLKFYQKQFEEYQRTEDKYKEKIDKHLKNLVADRHELEEEVRKRGEKISDLQKALVELQLSVFEERERFLKVSAENDELKRNEEQLHTNIRQLLAMTHQQDVRDKIIYILKDPKVEIGYQTDISTKSKSLRSHFPASKKLKEELECLQNQLDEVLTISKTKSDIVLDDCKQALEKSKAKIMEDEIQIRELQRRLQDLNTKMSSSAKSMTTESQVVKPASSAHSLSNERLQDLNAKKMSSAKSWPFESQPVKPSSSADSLSNKRLQDLNAKKSSSAKSLPTESQLVKPASSADSLSNVCSHMKDIHLSLILLLKVISKITNILISIQATKLYQRIANIPKTPSDIQHIVEENSIQQLDSSLRQCTLLTFEINNMHKSLVKYVSNNKKRIQNVNILRSELGHLEEMLREMTIITAENDLLNVDLKRTSFFYALRDSSVVIHEEDRIQHLNDFKKIISNSDQLHKIVSRAADFVESVVQKYNAKRDYWIRYADFPQNFSSTSVESQRETSQATRPAKSDSELTSLKQAKSKTLEDLEKLLGIYKRTVQEAENLGFGQSTEAKLLAEKLKATQKKLEEEEMLGKSDDYFKDDIKRPERKTSDYEETLRKINKTLSKLKLVEQGEYLKDEKLCKKLAENVNDLTKKFKELSEDFNVRFVQDQFSEYSRVTLSKLEELAKQSRNSVIAAEAQIAAHRSNAKDLSEKLRETEELLRESINECLSLKQKVKQAEERHERDKYLLVSGLREKLDKVTSTTELDGVVNELVTYVIDNKGTKADPFVCVYCQQGMGHKLCQEKLNDMKQNERRAQTQLKLLQTEAKQEKATFMHYRDIAEKTAADLGSTNEALKEAVKNLECKNASLLERLKLEKNRVKNMERFRHLEIEGFQTDIKNLKSKIRDLEKQLMKAVLIFENNNKDMELLKTVHETAQRSRQATAALRRLKAKLYELENDIKSL